MQVLQWLVQAYQALLKSYEARNDPGVNDIPDCRQCILYSMPPAPPQSNPDALLPWDNVPGSEANRHNVRAICDLEGLTYTQKEVLAACVKVESDFETQIVHPNFAFNSEGMKYLASTDYGICQINDFWHIGPTKEFPSSEFVLANPEACVQFMARYYKAHGHLNAWVSYTSKAYLKYLGKV